MFWPALESPSYRWLVQGSLGSGDESFNAVVVSGCNVHAHQKRNLHSFAAALVLLALRRLP